MEVSEPKTANLGGQVIAGNFSLAAEDAPYSCQTHGGYRGKKVRALDSDEWHEPACPSCTAEQTAKISAAEQARVRGESLTRAIERAGIPKRFQDKSLDSFVPADERQRRILEVCRDYLLRFDDVMRDGRCLIFSGKTGTGKTHLATAIANHLILAGRTAIFTSVREVVAAVKSTWRKGSTKTEQDALAPYIAADFLVLDEVGVQFDTEAEKLVMFDVINRRYQDMKPMIVISNLPMESEQGIPTIKSVLGDRIIDRLRENGGKLIKFEWDSHRGAA